MQILLIHVMALSMQSSFILLLKLYSGGGDVIFFHMERKCSVVTKLRASGGFDGTVG